MAAPAFAQESTSSDATEQQAQAAEDVAAADEDEIVFVAVRAAVQRKRDADTFINSIIATGIVSFPDKSVAEALQRVPGITVAGTNQADAAHYPTEPSEVIICGLTQVRSGISGRDSFSDSAGYGLDFADTSPDLLSAVDVFKTNRRT